MPRRKQAKPTQTATKKTSPKKTWTRTWVNYDAQQEENYSIIAGILAGLIILLWGWLLWSNQQRIIEIIDQPVVLEEAVEEDNSSSDFALFIGKELGASGFLVSDESHTYLSTTNYGIIWLENSDEFGDLKQGSAFIGGTITSFTNNTYFLTINTFSGESLLVDDMIDEGEDEIQVVQDMAFIAQAGLRFSDLLVNEFTVEPNTNQQFITVRKKNSKNKMTINYFQCVSGHKTYDCKKEMEKLQKSKNLEKAFTTKEGDNIYRIKKTNQRYASIDNRFGYYISSNSQQHVKDIVPYMDFMSDKFIAKYIAPQLTTICTDPSNGISLEKVTSRNQLFFDELLSMDIIGKDANGKALQCIVVVDLNNALGGSLISIDYMNPNDKPIVESGQNDILDEDSDDQTWTTQTGETIPTEELEEETDDEETDSTNSSGSNAVNSIDLDTSDVAQFKLKLEDPFVHTFNAGYTISFPSKNISFGSKNVQTTLELDNTNCSIRTDVIDFPNRDLKHETPSINIFVCNTSLSASEVGNLLYIPSSNDKKAYLIKVNDAAWVDFAKNITIED